MFNFKLIFMVEIFSNEKINVGRQVDLDLAKAGSIIFMVFVHCLLLADSFNSSFSPIFFHGIDDLLGGPMCAPLFMFCMGVGLVYSRNAQSDIMWGIDAVCSGYFGICRYELYSIWNLQET